MRVEITTRYKSNANGAGRYHARAKGFTATRSVQIDHSLSDDANHERAARALGEVIGAKVGYMRHTDNGRTFVAFTGNYEQSQIDNLPVNDVRYSLKLEAMSDDCRTQGATKWLNISRAQLDAIRVILGDA